MATVCRAEGEPAYGLPAVEREFGVQAVELRCDYHGTVEGLVHEDAG